MKFVKKITALFLALTMVMAMGITAFAADSTITGPSDGHTYKVYQIFTGTLGTDGQLGDVKWGQNGTGTTGEAVDSTILDALKVLENNKQDTADAVAAYVDLASEPIKTLDDTTASATVANGYYLIVDAGPFAEGEDQGTYIISVVKDLKISPKRSTITFQKKIKDTNDSTGETSEWQDSADYDIGDKVPFQLTGTIPSNYAQYDKYYYQFTDQMEKSLTFNKDSVKVYVDGNEITEGFTVSEGSEIQSGNFAGGTQFTVTFTNMKTIEAVKAGSKITVEFNATLNKDAVLGKQGNVNQAKLKYSNNPNDGGEGTNETGWDQVIAFTYKVIVNKVDQNEDPLKGAEFTLYKKIKDAADKEIAVTTITGDGTSFEFTGLDDGNYVLKETKTPDGYNTVADIEFTITAEHKVEWKNGEDRTTILTSLSGGNLGTGAVDTGAITGTVENKKGSVLPSTGGMGTTVLYIAGIAMIVAAGIVVIARKRNA